MESIIKYLQNPMSVGINHLQLLVDFADVADFFNKSLLEYGKTFEQSERRARVPKAVFQDRLERLKEHLTSFNENTNPENYLDAFSELLAEYSSLRIYPEELAKYWDPEPAVRRPIFRRRPIHFRLRILNNIKDVVLIEIKIGKDKEYIFDMISIKEDGVKYYKEFIESIPPLKEKIKIIKEKKHFSSRFVFRPYSLAIDLWLNSDESYSLPTDLKSFLQGASKYLSSDEWRTSIVLSSITTESILADLYEENFQKEAPDKPLGDLFYLVKDKVKFPSEILNAIEITNKARIAAVHRSRFEVSNREAINALYGSTNLTIWYICQ